MQDHTFGNMIRNARLAKSRGLCEMARELSITPTYLCDIEKDRRIPAENVLRRIATILSLDVDYLLATSGRFGEDVKRHMKRNPSVGTLLQCIVKQDLREDDIQKLIKKVGMLGKTERSQAV